MKKLFNYLRELESHNERPWYHAHKAEKAESDAAFYALVQELIFRTSELEPDMLYRTPAELIYRLPRDARVWKDKPPYNPSYRAHLSVGARKMVPLGCFLCLQPGGRSFVSGGLYSPSFREATLMIREHIYYHPAEWTEIVAAPAFAENFEVLGEKLKNVPRDFPPETEHGEALKHKSWYVMKTLTDREVLSAGLSDRILELYAAMKPFNDFLNEALRDFKLPEYE